MNKLRRTILKAGSLLTAGIGTMPYMVQARQFLNDDPELCSKHISLHSGVKLFSSADNQAVQIITQIGRSLSIPSTEIIHGATTVDFVLSLPRLLSDVAPQYVIGCVDNALLALCIDAARNADVRWVWSSEKNMRQHMQKEEAFDSSRAKVEKTLVEVVQQQLYQELPISKAVNIFLVAA